jgi:2-oxoglutarate dehydrogenase E2 component (dihydrolipoamide succinyltransferase)
MILEMKVPSPGESIKEVEIATWLVKDGDYVEKDQAIAEVDSDKATLELPAEASGIITLKAEEGDAVAVGAVVCLIDTDAAKPSGSAPVAEAKPVAEAPKVEVKAEAPKAAPVPTTYAATRHHQQLEKY